MSRILFVTRPSSTNGIRQFLASEFRHACAEVSWDNYQSSHFTPPDDLFVFDLSDGVQQTRAFAISAHRPDVQRTLAIVPPDLPHDLMLALTRRVDEVVQTPCFRETFLGHIRQLLGASPNREAERVTRSLIREFGLSQIIGEHPRLRAVLDRIEIIARVDLPALIFGETGTGKELCARAIHALSKRSDQPFVPVECGAIPAELAESEIFGHARGAYTDARSATVGVVGMAEGGTLFLDEIDSLSLPVQAKLLRFLQEGTFRSLGSDKYKRANVRVIAASNRSLARAVREKAFRDDLFFRLSVLRVDLPPLRERLTDIPLLAHHFLQSSQTLSAGAKRFHSGVITKLQRHNWPGNVRELSNVIKRAVLFSSGLEIGPQDIVFDEAFDSAESDQVLVQHDFRSAKATAVTAFERQYLSSLLQEHGGNITRAASAAGQDRSAFRRLLKKHGISPSSQA